MNVVMFQINITQDIHKNTKDSYQEVSVIY